MQKLEFNSQKTGFFLGIILPVTALLAFYFFRYRAIPIAEFFRFVYFRNILSPLVSLTVLPNLLLFFIFLRSNFLRGARGVLLASFVLTIVVVIIKALS
jgi:hypothetical protein